MKKLCILSMIAVAALAQNPFAGRWDMTVTVGNNRFPSWLEVTEKSGNLEARVQQATGNVAPVSAVKMDGKKLMVTVSAAAGTRPEHVWELTAAGGKLTGTARIGDSTRQLAGVKAPALKAAPVKAWTTPEPLFNGKDLTGWQPINNTPEAIAENFTNHWVAKNGELTNEGRGSNIRTTRTFNDFKLHLEFLCPPGENSGVYLRGRYEVQIAPTPDPSRPPAPAPAKAGGGYRNPFPGLGSVYGMIGPSTPPVYRPDWQTYDITLVGRWVTVVFNGVTLIDNQEIAGVTGGALDSNEGEPGPIYFQGDHHGDIRYRNITMSVPKR